MGINFVAQNRKSDRSPVLLSARLERNGEAQAVRLRNLSAEGALLKFVFRLDRLQDDCSSRVAEGTQPHMLASR